MTVTSADLVTLRLGTVSVVWDGVADGPKKLAVLEALLTDQAGRRRSQRAGQPGHPLSLRRRGNPVTTATIASPVTTGAGAA